jgi:hypothetical protein
MCDSCAALAFLLLLGTSSVALHGGRTPTTASPSTIAPAPSTASSATVLPNATTQSGASMSEARDEQQRERDGYAAISVLVDEKAVRSGKEAKVDGDQRGTITAK